MGCKVWNHVRSSSTHVDLHNQYTNAHTMLIKWVVHSIYKIFGFFMFNSSNFAPAETNQMESQKNQMWKLNAAKDGLGPSKSSIEIYIYGQNVRNDI